MIFYYHSQENMQKYKKRISRKNFKESFQNLFLSRRILELFYENSTLLKLELLRFFRISLKLNILINTNISTQKKYRRHKEI